MAAATSQGGSLPEETQEDAVTKNDIYDAIATERRRIALRYVLENDDGDGVELGELAEAVEFVQGDYERIDEIGSKARKAVYVGLYQDHVPVLADAGLVESDKRKNRVFTTATTAAVVDVIDTVESRLCAGDSR